MVCVITKPASMQQDFLKNHSYNGGFGSHRKGIEKIVKWIVPGYFFNTLDQVSNQSSFMSVGISDGKINVL